MKKINVTYEKSREEIYLSEIHNKLDFEQLLNLHTYFYWKDFELCPICNELLTMRGKPEATT